MAETERYWSHNWIIPALILFSILLTIIISYSSPVRQLKLNVKDKLFELRGPIPVEDTAIVIVEISQQADQEIPYKYPWPTNLHAKLIENLDKAGAKAIGFDVIYDKRDNYNLSNDTLFADAIRKHGNVILAGNIQVVRQNRGSGSQSVSTTLVRPNNVLSAANKNPLGLVRVFKDEDSAVRRYILSVENNDEEYLSLGLELLKLYAGVENIRDEESVFRMGSYEIPKYGRNTMAINYFGKPRTFPFYSYETVIDDSTIILESEDEDFQINSFSDPDFGLINSDVFRDKIVLIGATMPELQDFHSTPFAGNESMPGVEMHANALQTILSGKYIYHASPKINLFLLILAVVIIVLLTRFISGYWGLILYLALCILAGGLAIFEFLHFSYIIDIISILTALTVGFITTQSYEYVVEQREKRRIRELFSSYVSPAVVEEMVESGKDPELGGDEVYITAFFSDIQSFSSFSEQLPAKKLVKLINEYLSAMTDILTEQGGTLDKYIGDAIVGIFGAPVEIEDHAYRACLVSQLMQQKLAELREKWRNENEQWPEIVCHMQNRIGINTGHMVTGNMGSKRRFNYTMMGDNVNLAARCESGAKKFGVYTMVTGETKQEAEKLGDRCVFRYLDRIVVKGRKQPVDVYEIMGLKDQLEITVFECKEIFEAGVAAYHNQKWDRALEYFEESETLETYHPGDSSMISTNPSLVYQERCKRMKDKPPPTDWNGVYVMKSK